MRDSHTTVLTVLNRSKTQFHHQREVRKEANQGNVMQAQVGYKVEEVEHRHHGGIKVLKAPCLE